MAAVNSLLFLLSTIAPYTEPPVNTPTPYPPTAWKSHSVLKDDDPGFAGGTNTTGETRCVTPWINKGPQLCEANAHYERCGFICPETCCPYECVLNCCVEGCFCDEGYLRGPEETCIKREECPPTCDNYMDHSVPDTPPIDFFPDKECPKNEWYTCSSHCQRRCEKSWWPCPGWCVPGCECMWPLVRARDGQCVFPDQCPYHSSDISQDEEECESDQEMSCYSHCERNCTNYDQEIPCSIYCDKGCVCKEPKIRGPDGICILPEFCPSSELLTQDIIQDKVECESDQEISCYSHCEKNCTNYEQEIPCSIYCVKGCVCKEPKIRGPDGSCILPEYCPSSELLTQGLPKCRDDEVFMLCDALCEDNCYSYDYPVPCPALCKSGCVCKRPLVREVDGRCVLPRECRKRSIEDEQCLENPEVCSIEKDENLNSQAASIGLIFPSCRGENEVWSICPARCPDDCDNYQNNRRACKRICLPIPKCECESGFVRGPNGKCIKPEQCPTYDGEFI